MENTYPSSKWGYIFRWILLLLTRWIPGWVLRWRFPVGRCQEQVVVMAEGVPDIWINPGRPPVISFLIVLVNRLPFPVIVNGLHLEINLEGSRDFAKFDRINRIKIAGGEIAKANVEHDLSDSQAEIVRKYPSDCPLLQIQGYVQMETPVGEFNKELGIETRAFVYRG